MNIENTQAQMRKGILGVLHFTDHRPNTTPTCQDIINKLRASKMLVVEGTVISSAHPIKEYRICWPIAGKNRHRALPGNITTSPNKDVNSCKPWKLRGKN